MPKRSSKPTPKPNFDVRAAGVLLHLTSLPGPHGSGDLGAHARSFADFLADAGQGFWQMLPVNPTGAGNSPYSGASAFAGNPMLISLTDLAAEGLLKPREIAHTLPDGRVDYERTEALRRSALKLATTRVAERRREYREALSAFRARTSAWLDAYCLFMALSDKYGGTSWTKWPTPLARRKTKAIAAARQRLHAEISHYELEQFLFDRQWRALRSYCTARGIALIGDIPIFVSHASADVWAHANYFRLDAQGEPACVAGVPPDYFSKTGQRWGNPLYRWKRLARDGYSWWIDRFRTLLERFDVVRLDHFIGFSRYWEIPASEPTAEHGRYLKGPGDRLFVKARRELGAVPFIAEDLGAVTPKVTALRERLGFPGMRVLQFAFGTDVQAESFLPHNYVRRAVAYTGTHDNDTIVGFFDDRGGGKNNPRSTAQASAERRAVIAYVAGPHARRLASPTHWELIRVVYGSVANTVIVPMQDILGLDARARMNTPGQAAGCWTWRMRERDQTAKLAEELRRLTEIYQRIQR